MSGAKCARYSISPALLAAKRRRAAALTVRDSLIARIAAFETLQAARRKANRTETWEGQLENVSGRAVQPR